MLQIVDLAPEHIETLARWHDAEWGSWTPERPIDFRIEALREHLGPDFVPSTYVALMDEPVGSASIVNSDLDSRPDLRPWLAAVYVVPAARHRGVGRALVRHVLDQARAHGLQTLYLFTTDRVAFYEHLGWTRLGDGVHRRIPVTIMYSRFDPESP